MSELIKNIADDLGVTIYTQSELDEALIKQREGLIEGARAKFYNSETASMFDWLEQQIEDE